MQDPGQCNNILTRVYVIQDLGKFIGSYKGSSLSQYLEHVVQNQGQFVYAVSLSSTLVLLTDPTLLMGVSMGLLNV